MLKSSRINHVDSIFVSSLDLDPVCALYLDEIRWSSTFPARGMNCNHLFSDNLRQNIDCVLFHRSTIWIATTEFRQLNSPMAGFLDGNFHGELRRICIM